MQISKPAQIAIFLISLVVIIAGNHLLPLLDWDEANFGEVAREMIVTGNYLEPQVAYDSFYEKPPVFFWLQSGAMHLFGINEFAARFPVALFGALTLLLLYRIGSKEIGHYFGIIWVLMYAGSIHFLYFKLGLIDPVFNYFIILGFYYLYKQEKLLQEVQNARTEALLIGLFIGIAVLTKGPVAVLIVGLVWLVRVLFSRVSIMRFLSLSVLSILGGLIVISIWVVPLLLSGKTAFFEAFFYYQLELAGGQIEWHNQPWFYHIIVLLVICFPASIFCWPYLFKRYTRAIPNLDFYMACLFWIVLIVFSIVSTKIIHYSSLCWYPITYFAAKFAYQKFTNRLSPKKRYLGWGIISIGLILGTLCFAVPLIMNQPGFIDENLSKIKDSFAVDQIRTHVNWPLYLSAIGAFFALGCLFLGIAQLRKKGSSVWLGSLLVTFLFANAVYIFLLPKVANHTQNRFISKVVEIDKSGALQYNLGFRTYAMYFYGKFYPSDKKVQTSNGKIYTYAMPEKSMWDWAMEVSNLPSKTFYMWHKGKNSTELDSAWLNEGEYNGYYLYKKVRRD